MSDNLSDDTRKTRRVHYFGFHPLTKRFIADSLCITLFTTDETRIRCRFERHPKTVVEPRYLHERFMLVCIEHDY